MAAEGPAVSVVVAAFDRRERVGRLLESLRAQTLDPGRFEVIVVDDGSADGTAAMVEALATDSPHRLRLIARSSQGGPAAARNEGWRAAEAPLVAFIDDDCEADPAWLERLLATARRLPGAVVQGRTRANPAEAGAAGPFSVTREIDGTGPWWFETCNIAYPRALLERLDGFDEAFAEPLGEDTDLGWRALEAGASRVFEPRAVVDHAVIDLGRGGHLRRALRGADAVLAFKRHPRLRAQALGAGVVRNPVHTAHAAGVRRAGRFARGTAPPRCWRCRTRARSRAARSAAAARPSPRTTWPMTSSRSRPPCAATCATGCW